DSVLGVELIQQRFCLQPTWDYTFDVVNQRMDSTPKQAVILTYLPSTAPDCLAQAGGTLTLYPEFYHHKFDSATGEILSSVLDTVYADTLITYAPVIYRAYMDSSDKWINN